MATHVAFFTINPYLALIRILVAKFFTINPCLFVLDFLLQNEKKSIELKVTNNDTK